MKQQLMQATGRRIWNASSIYVPVLIIAGEFDTWSFPEDREGLMRDLTNAPLKRSVPGLSERDASKALLSLSHPPGHQSHRRAANPSNSSVRSSEIFIRAMLRSCLRMRLRASCEEPLAFGNAALQPTG